MRCRFMSDLHGLVSGPHYNENAVSPGADRVPVAWRRWSVRVCLATQAHRPVLLGYLLGVCALGCQCQFLQGFIHGLSVASFSSTRFSSVWRNGLSASAL